MGSGHLLNDSEPVTQKLVDKNTKLYNIKFYSLLLDKTKSFCMTDLQEQLVNNWSPKLENCMFLNVPGKHPN